MDAGAAPGGRASQPNGPVARDQISSADPKLYGHAGVRSADADQCSGPKCRARYEIPGVGGADDHQSGRRQCFDAGEFRAVEHIFHDPIHRPQPISTHQYDRLAFGLGHGDAAPARPWRRLHHRQPGQFWQHHSRDRRAAVHSAGRLGHGAGDLRGAARLQRAVDAGCRLRRRGVCDPVAAADNRRLVAGQLGQRSSGHVLYRRRDWRQCADLLGADQCKSTGTGFRWRCWRSCHRR